LADKYVLNKEISIFHGNLQNKKPQNVAYEVWPVQELANKYKKYADKMKKSASKLNAGPNSGQTLPFLYLYGSELFEIIQDDPQLPMELLPFDWLVPKVTQAFSEIRKQMLPLANSFIDEIME